MYVPKHLKPSSEYLLLCFTGQSKSYRFGMTENDFNFEMKELNVKAACICSIVYCCMSNNVDHSAQSNVFSSE